MTRLLFDCFGIWTPPMTCRHMPAAATNLVRIEVRNYTEYKYSESNTTNMFINLKRFQQCTWSLAYLREYLFSNAILQLACRSLLMME